MRAPTNLDGPDADSCGGDRGPNAIGTSDQLDVFTPNSRWQGEPLDGDKLKNPQNGALRPSLGGSKDGLNEPKGFIIG